MANENIKDPLDELVKRHQAALNGEPYQSSETVSFSEEDTMVEPSYDDSEISLDGTNDISDEDTSDEEYDASTEDSDWYYYSMNDDDDEDDDEYGNNALDEEIAREDAEREAARKKLAQEQLIAREAERKKKVAMGPMPDDKNFQLKAIDFQANKVAIVTTMLNQVVSKYHIVSGEIPDNPPPNSGVLSRFQVMGELIKLYEDNGEQISPEFEKMIISNWILSDGSLAINSINDDGAVVDTAVNQKSTGADKKTETNKPEIEPAKIDINIDVEKGTPITLNVDESITAKLDETNHIDVHVREVSEEEMLKSFIIENSNQEGIITPYDSGLNDVPITLPLSGYRCVMRPINWLDFIKLAAPTSNNPSDVELKKWSVIYNHMKNISIGNFKDFDDFLKKTKYGDKDILLWGILVATADEQETLSFRCGNPKCRKSISIPYYPRTVAHLDEDNMPAHYKKTHSVAIGPDAIAHFEEVNSKRTRYKLPNTGIIVEADKPSAFDFITVKLPLMQKLYDRYRPGEGIANVKLDDTQLAEFDYLSANALGINSMSIIKDGKEYRYTHWEDIEEIISTSLSAEDAGVLLKIVEIVNDNSKYPIKFYVSDVTCPLCKRHEDRIPIDDIGNQLLFQLSRRLGSTTVNLIEMP